MKKFLKRLFLQQLENRVKRLAGESPMPYRRAKAIYRLRLHAIQIARSTILISLGILSAGLGLKGFLLPKGFIDGGVTGISLLMAVVTNFSLAPLIILINLPFLWMAYRQVNITYALRSAFAIGGLAIALHSIPFPTVTYDPLLIAAFGGFFLGLGIGLAMRGGAVLDGTEILAIYIGRKTGLKIGDIILIFNILIFSVAAYLLNIETALYAILTYLAASRTVDFVIEGVEEYIGVTVVSSHYEEIRIFIVMEMGRGVTIYNGMRGHGQRRDLHHTEILFTVITRLEITRLQQAIERIDSNAFVSMHSVRDTHGGIIKKRAWKEH